MSKAAIEFTQVEISKLMKMVSAWCKWRVEQNPHYPPDEKELVDGILQKLSAAFWGDND